MGYFAKRCIVSDLRGSVMSYLFEIGSRKATWDEENLHTILGVIQKFGIADCLSQHGFYFR